MDNKNNKNSDIRALTTKAFFSRSTTVSVSIRASPAAVWSLLTDSQNMTNWNSTIISCEGAIALNQKIKIRSTLAPNRVFKLKIVEYDPCKTLSWGDSMGTRVFRLESFENITKVTVSETIGGPLFPIFARMIP